MTLCVFIKGIDEIADTATIYHTVACFYKEIENYQSAYDYFKIAYIIRKSNYGEEHSKTKLSYNRMLECKYELENISI